MKHTVSLSLKEVKAGPNGPVLGLHIVASPNTFVANVGDTLEFAIKPGLPYATNAYVQDKELKWTIEFIKPNFENNDSNTPHGWPFKGKGHKIEAKYVSGPVAVIGTPAIISRDKKPAKSGKNLARRYTYSVTAEIPWGDENPSFPTSLLKNSDGSSGTYKVTDDPEIYVDEC